MNIKTIILTEEQKKELKEKGYILVKTFEEKNRKTYTIVKKTDISIKELTSESD